MRQSLKQSICRMVQHHESISSLPLSAEYQHGNFFAILLRAIDEALSQCVAMSDKQQTSTRTACQPDEVNEIDPSGAQVEVTTFVDPRPASPPSTLPTSTTLETASQCHPNRDQKPSDGRQAPTGGHVCQASKTMDDGAPDAVDAVKVEVEVSWPEQLRRLVGSEGMIILSAINAASKAGTMNSEAARAPQKISATTCDPDLNGSDVPNATVEASQTGIEGGHGNEAKGAAVRFATGCVFVRGDDDGGVVRIPAGRGAVKAERAKVHRAVQETFPFVTTTTEKGPGDAVTVVCARSKPHPALRELLSESELEALQRLVNRGPNAATGAGDGVVLAGDPDRDHRTRVHRAVAQAFPYLQTKTEADPSPGNASRICISWKKRHGCAKRKRQRPSAGGGDGPRPLGDKRGRGEGEHGRQGVGQQARVEALDTGSSLVKFALRKEEREHHRMAAALSTVLHVPLSALSFAGMKDKMAITTQVCVVKGVPPGRILSSNGTIAGVTVGNLSFCDRPLSVGELSGNRFSVVIRGANASEAVVDRAVRDASSAGFANFFGTQRVGSPLAAAQGLPLSYQIGRDMLSGDWEAAVRKVLFPRNSDTTVVREALSDLRDGKIGPKECLARMKGKNRLRQEKAVLQGLARFGDSAYEEALQRVPYAMRTMWVRAYQSHVWNSMASARICLLGPRATPGDLILSSEHSVKDDKGNPITNTAPAFAPVDVDLEGFNHAGMGMRDVEESGCAVVGVAPGEGSRDSGTLCSGWRRAVTVLTKENMEALASEGVTAEDLFRRVVLPLPGKSVQYPSHQIGDLYKRRLDQDGVDPLMWRMIDQEKSVGSVGLNNGTTPPALAISSSQPIAAPEEQVASNTPVGAVRAAVPQPFCVPKGVYRSLLCTPVDVSWREIPPWSRPARCSIEAGGDINDGIPAGGWRRKKLEDGVNQAEAEAAKEEKRVHGQETVGPRVTRTVGDIAISFSLPAGSFATMFLREVMKSDHDIAWGGRQTEEEDDGREEERGTENGGNVAHCEGT